MRDHRRLSPVLLLLLLLLSAIPLAAQMGDGDGDGVRDGLDLCPNERGPIANLGCASPRVGISNAVASPIPALSVTGRVWNDQDGDGVQDANEPGLASVPVELWDANRTALLASAHTDATGFYTVPVPTSGNYRLRVVAIGYGLSPKDAAGDATDSDFSAVGTEAGFSDVLGVTTAVAAAPRIDAGLRPSLTASPTANLFNAQAAPALTLVLAPTNAPTVTAGFDFVGGLTATMSPEENEDQAATLISSLNNPPGQNRPQTITLPGPNRTQIAQWQTSVAQQTITAQPTVTGTLSATPTPAPSPTPSVTPTGTLPTAAPTVNQQVMTQFWAYATGAAQRATANASATHAAAVHAANQSLLNTAAASRPSNTPFSIPIGPFTATPPATPTDQTFFGQIAPAITFVLAPSNTPTLPGPNGVSPTPRSTATPPPMIANPVQGGAQAAITIIPPRSSATPAAVLIQPDTAVQAVTTPVDGESVQPTTAFDRDGDFVPDMLDSCPDERNLTPDGCPPPNLDRDGDGTLDYADACPDQAGDLTSRAHDMECPDTDNDGWTDNVDDCPSQPALLFGGCPAAPDRDGDGVLDNDDQCPDVRYESSSGCPDSDGDGLNDSGDACPNQPAPLSANGCPTANDRDGDAIPNQVDRCPDSFNLTINGCPPGVREFTPTYTPTITPASVDLTGPTPGLVFVPSTVPTATPIPQVGSPLDGAQAAITVLPVVASATVEAREPITGASGGGERVTLTPSRTLTPIPIQAVNPVLGESQPTVSPSPTVSPDPRSSDPGTGGGRITLTPSPSITPNPPQVANPLDGAQAAITVIPVLPSATPPGVIGISPTPPATQGPTPTVTLTPNLVFQPPAVRAPASLAWDPFSASPLLSARNLSFTDPNPPGSGVQLVVSVSVANGELFTFDPVAGRISGRRLVFDTVQELTNLLAGLYFLPGEWDGSNPRIILQAYYLRGLNDRSPVVSVEVGVIVPTPTRTAGSN